MRVADVVGAVRCAGCHRFGTPLCSDCVLELTPAGPVPALDGVDRALAGLAYEGAARKLVLGLKLTNLRPMARPLVEGMARTVWRHGLVGDLVTWVPGRAWDVLDRGFDHAHSLARPLARRTGLPLKGLLRRSGHSKDQSSLGRAERWDNLSEAFVGGDCRGRGVILVDDLITTGATATACALALRRAGASSVEVITACRA